MKKLSFLIIAVGLATAMHGVCLAQTSAIPQTVRAVNTIERLTDSNGLGLNEMLYGIPLPPGKVIGDNYLFTEWKPSALLLYEGNKLVEGYPIRYDLAADELDIKTAKGVKVLEGRKVRSFAWIDSTGSEPSYFVNAKDYRYDNVPLTGFFQVLVDGNSPLFKRTSIVIKKADYNQALNVGSRDDKILKKEVFFVALGNHVEELPDSKKKVFSMFKTNADQMEEFIKSQDLSVKREDDLIRIFRHYNELLVQKG